MDRMNSQDNDSKLDALFAQYRDAMPDDAVIEKNSGASFMPGLWQKIDARRSEKVFALDTLFAEYREAVPDPDPSPSFMPGLWKRIELRRNENVSVFRRWAQVCMLATAALTLAMVAITHIQSEPVYSASYVDVLDAAHSVDSAHLMDSGDFQ
jgi:hypothetical protein